jgi:hypothetical protein
MNASVLALPALRYAWEIILGGQHPVYGAHSRFAVVGLFKFGDKLPVGLVSG